MFSIYIIQYFLSDGLDAKVVGTVSDYNFDPIESLVAAGFFTYSQDKPCYSIMQTACLVDINLTK
jgi:hypothetical protein